MLDIQIYVPLHLLYREYEGFPIRPCCFAVILCCFTFVSCPMDIRFMIDSPLFPIGNSFHVGPISAEIYSLTVMRL